MTRRITHLNSWILACIAMFITFLAYNLLATTSFAAATLNLSPASGNIGLGKNTTVQIRLNSGGESVNAVSAYISYPQDKLEVVGVNYGGSAFDIAAESVYGGGVVKISRGRVSGTTGNLIVGSITFRGKVLGSAGLAFIGGSGAARASDSVDVLSIPGSRGSTLNVVEAVAEASPEAVSALTVSAVKLENVTRNSAEISWMTDKTADSQIEYGLEQGVYILNASSTDAVTEHRLKLEGPLLTAGAKIYFKVKSKDRSGAEGIGPEQVIQLPGYNVNISIIDKDGLPIKNNEVYLYSEVKTGITDENGMIRFDNVPLGKHLVVVKSGEIEKTGEIIVEDVEEEQIFTIQLDLSPVATKSVQLPQINPLYLGLGALFLLINIGIIIFAIHKRRSKQQPPNQPPPAPPVDTPSQFVQSLPTPEQQPGQPIVFTNPK